MTFSDIFKKSFLEGYVNTDITTYTVLVSLLITCFLALYIFFLNVSEYSNMARLNMYMLE